MIIQVTKRFDKELAALPFKIRQQVDKRITLFLADPSAPQLHRHQLKGEGFPLWSINITGDFRVLYEDRGDKIVLKHIGTHSQLYG